MVKEQVSWQFSGLHILFICEAFKGITLNYYVILWEADILTLNEEFNP